MLKKLQTRRPASTGIFSQEYKYFDQHLPTVKTETTVENLVCERFLKTTIPPLISTLYVRPFVQNFVSQYQKISLGNPFAFHHFRVPKKFMNKRGYQDFPSKVFCLTVPKFFVGEPFSFPLI